MKKIILFIALMLCFQTLITAQGRKFTSLAMNTQNGGFWFIGDDKRLYATSFNFGDFQPATIQGKGYVENLTGWHGTLFVRSLDELGMMAGGNADPYAVRPIALALPGHPNAKYVFGDRVRNKVWHIGMDNFIAPYGSVSSSEIPPRKEARMFTVYNGVFFMLQPNDNTVYTWQPGYGAWKPFSDIKATFITRDPGFGTPLWYIGEDANVYIVTSADGVTRYNYSFGQKAQSLCVFGGNPHIIGTDGYFYVGHRQTWLQVPFN
jgi:hypothetical protein